MAIWSYITSYFSAFFFLIKDLWSWFILGFVIAALVQEFVPTRKLLEYFGSNDWKSLLRATFSGLFISVCSCGAIPIASMLRKRGMSTATTLTFLLATPWAGLVHLFIMASFLGFKNTFFLLLASLTVAFISGLVLSHLENKRWIEQKLHASHRKGEKVKCTHCLELEDMGHKNERWTRRFFYCVPKNMWCIFTDIGKYMFIGIFIAAALKAFVPHTIITEFLGKGSRFFPILLAIPVSSVIELCSEGFTVLAGQLYVMGASLGVVFTMIMVGVSTDFTELSMIFGQFGKRSVIAYLVTSIVLVVIFAFLINIFL
ncbi:hypothetical protein FJZ53_07355 [Candidatus Woesearchaeota archaeon]|nr:hypothetical protein [Candidatus Woesearchaeota archaeon]